MSFSYILKRILMAALLIILISMFVFAILPLTGDPVYMILGDEATEEAIASLRSRLNLDKPLPVRYYIFVSGAIRGDLGRSFITGRDIAAEISRRLPVTMRIALLAILVEIFVGVFLGALAAFKHRTVIDNFAMVFALLGISTPPFWLALMLMLVFALHLGWFPISGYSGLISLILPAFSIGLLGDGRVARMTRSALLEVMRQDYIRTAKAKGLSFSRVINKHAAKNAMIPVVTLIGIDFGRLLAGSIIIETVFALPGVGQLVINGILRRDYPMVQGVVLLMGIIFTIANLLVDIIYSFLDPRIKYS